MKLADELRDDKLAEIGIRLADKGPQQSVWNLESVEVLMNERQAKLETKLKKEQEKREKEAETLRRNSTPGKDFFMVLEPADFTQFDDEGVPTHKKGKKNKEKDGSITFGPDVEI